MEPGRSSWCSIVPEYLLREVAENKEASSEVRTAAEKTIEEGRDLFTRSTIDSGMVGEIAGKQFLSPLMESHRPPSGWNGLYGPQMATKPYQVQSAWKTPVHSAWKTSPIQLNLMR
jgi:hypothetical protein